MCTCGFCNMWVCVFCNVWEYVCVGFVICGCVYVWVSLMCVIVFLCGFCNVWVCMSGFCNVWVCV